MQTIDKDTFEKILMESVREHVRDYLLKERIKGFVRENISNYDDFAEFEAEGAEEKKADGREADFKNETDKELARRDQVETFFKRPGVNNAAYAYELYHVKPQQGKDTNKMKNARKKFSDNVNHAKNQYGHPYSFSSAEVNRLRSMISNNELSEAISRSVEKTLNELREK